MLIYRAAQLQDLSHVYTFERQYICELEPHMLERWDASARVHQAHFKNNIHRMFIAESKEQPIGFSYWGIHENEAHILSIYVEQDYRGQKVARTLLQCVEQDLLQQGHTRCTLSTLESNPAQHLFLRSDYVISGIHQGWISLYKHLK